MITIDFPGTSSNPVMLRDIRIAAGGKGIYDELLEKGRVITRGILFDTGSERLRPESTPTLKEMCTMLTEHPDLRLEIEGHTDSVGTEAYNQERFQKRAESVSVFLVGDCGVDGSRLVAKGLGESSPLTENETPEDRQKNRRVELVKP